MGMYDEIICHFPLPTVPPEFITHDHRFQTKDLDCRLEVFTIGADGIINIPDYTGTIEFYTSNWVASGPGVYTANGEDFESVEYRAEFVGSRLHSIVEQHRERRPALPVSKFCERRIRQLAETGESDNWQERMSAPMVGRSLYVLWGGQTAGYWGDVVAESEREVCIRIAEIDEGSSKGIGRLEVINRIQLDATLFESKEDAERINGAKQAAWDAEKQEYDDLLAERASQSA